MGNVIAVIVVGFLAGMLVVSLRKGGRRLQGELDERQKILRYKVGMHSLVFGGGLLFGSSLLSILVGPHWIAISLQNFAIFSLTSIYFVIELLVRGAYFGRNFGRRQLLAFIILAGIYWLSLIQQAVDFLNKTVPMMQGII